MFMHISIYIPCDEKGYVTNDAWRPSFSESGEIPTLNAWHQIAEHIDKFYAETDPADIVMHNEARQAEHIAMNNYRPSVKEQAEDKHGWIYVLRAGDYYKIGRAQNPVDRYSQLATLPPWPTEIVHMFETENYHAIEKDLHDLFSAKRANGEWFALDTEDVELLRSLE